MHRWIGAASLAVALAGGAGTAGAQNGFHAPPVFASQNGTLDILMNVKQQPIPTITFTSPTTGKKINRAGWAYEICQRTSSGQTSCPSVPGTVWDYGGTRLTLWHSIDRRFISWGAAGWHIGLDSLDFLLAGHPIGRVAGADAMKFEGWQRLNVEYAKQFGMEPPKASPSAAKKP